MDDYGRCSDADRPSQWIIGRCSKGRGEEMSRIGKDASGCVPGSHATVDPVSAPSSTAWPDEWPDHPETSDQVERRPATAPNPANPPNPAIRRRTLLLVIAIGLVTIIGFWWHQTSASEVGDTAGELTAGGRPHRSSRPAGSARVGGPYGTGRGSRAQRATRSRRPRYGSSR